MSAAQRDHRWQPGLKRRRSVIGRSWVLAGWLVASSSAMAADGLAELRIVGSDLLGEEVANALRELGRRHETTVTVELTGSRAASTELAGGRAEIGLVLLPSDAPPSSDTCLWRPLAYAATFVVVPRDLPLAQISLAELTGIFGAEAPASLSRWGELGLTGEWSARAITPHALQARMGWSTGLFRERALQGAGLRSAVQLEDSPAALARKLVAEAGGIALTGTLPDETSPVKVLSVSAGSQSAAAAPTAANLHAGDYPLRVPLWLVIRREIVPAQLALLRELCGEDFAAALARGALVPAPAAVRRRLALELEGG